MRYFFIFFKETSEFVRGQFTTLTWHTKDGKLIKTNPKLFAEIMSLDYYCEIKATRAGSFSFYILFEDW